MTTRTFNIGAADEPLQASASCIGGDGKYETFQGVQRLKWNNYTADFTRTVRSPGQEPTHIGNQWWSGISRGFLMSSNDILTVQSRLSESVKGHDFNLAVNAAQGKQTVSMVVAAAQSVGGAILDLKRGKFESAARRFGIAPRPSRLSEKDVAGRWLELQYGWLPLLSDVHEAAKAYASITNKARVQRFNESVGGNFNIDNSLSPTIYSLKGVHKERWRIIYEATEVLSTPRSLGLTDPASVVWELIPYSFVVDWFIPIGSYLENLNTIPQLQGRFLTIKSRSFSGSAYPINKTINWGPAPRTHHSYFGVERIVSTSLSVPKPNFISLPDAMSPSRIWNALALVTQRIR